MAKSRTARRAPALLIVFAAPRLACAQAVTPEEAIARQQAEIRALVGQSCPPGTEPDEVVVCGRREPMQRYRVPFPETGVPAAMREQAGGEQLSAMRAGDTACGTVGLSYGCGSVDFLGMGIAIIRAVVKGIQEHRD